MRAPAIRLLALTLSTAVAVPLLTTTDAEASSRHIRKHHHQSVNLGRNDSWRRASAEQGVHTAAAPSSRGGDVCPGGRGFDCKIWPPPIDDDPDRKATDGGP